ncbi:MAG: protein kinase, partial [Polyangiaceae bacterium]|nr:protein kinase [Polyangiaceae bacterium]
MSALELGANDYVTKPIDFPVLVARIESQLGIRAEMATARRRSPVVAFDGSVEPGTVLDGRYEVLEVIGEGGFAVVFKARQLSTGQTVALKLLRAHRIAGGGDPSVERKRFAREMKLIGQLHHSNIVRLIDSGSIEVEHNQAPASADSLSLAQTVLGIPETRAANATSEAGESSSTMTVPYLVMEYLPGLPLSAFLRGGRRLPWSTAVDLLLPLLSAVGLAHRAGVVHRDLKPPNIIVFEDSRGGLHPKVLDFGIAKLRDEESTGLTHDSSFVGTPDYMSPEQARGTGSVTPRSDQYALGVILYECVTGRRPYATSSFMELVHLIAAGSFEPPSVHTSELPPELERVILRAMHVEPTARFRSLESFGAALLPFASSEVAAQWGPAFTSPSEPPFPPGMEAHGRSSGVETVSLPSPQRDVLEESRGRWFALGATLLLL